MMPDNRFKRHYLFFKNLVLMLMVVVLAGCSSIILNSHMGADVSGVRYFLPKTLVTVKIIPVGVKKDATTFYVSEKEAKIAETRGQVLTYVTVAGGQYQVLLNDKGELMNDLVIGLKLEVTSSPDNVADPETGMTMQYNPSVVTTDRVCVGVSKESLLSYAQARVKDETPNIAVSIGKLAGRIAGPAALFGGDNFAAGSDMGGAIEVVIDPLNKNDWRRVDEAINLHFPKFRDKYRFSAKGIQQFLPATNEPTSCPENSLCYRTRVPLRLSLRHRFSREESFTYTKVVNRAQVHSIDVSRAMLVEKVTMLGFDKGVLKTVQIQKPSEGLAAAKLPLTIYDAVLTSALAAPGQFFDEISPGISNSAISNFQTNVNSSNKIKSNLDNLREADLTSGGVAAQAIELTCN